MMTNLALLSHKGDRPTGVNLIGNSVPAARLLAGHVTNGVAIRPGFDKRYSRVVLILEAESKAPDIH